MEPIIDLENVREDEGRDIAYVKKKSRRRRKKKRILKGIAIFLILLFAGLVAGCFALFFSGQKVLEEKGNASRPELKPVQTKEVVIETEILDEDTLKYNGSKYKYNKDMINLLFMGVDTTGAVSGETTGQTPAGSAGQADTIILAALNNKAKTVQLIPINRDTMTDVSIYDIYGKFTGKQKEQIALAYAFGDGESKSAELTKDAVSNLFYGLPIHGYFSVNMSAITVVNDMVGGVEVTLEDDMTGIDPSFTKGSTVLLSGSHAESFLRTRSGIGDGTNASRMGRQKQYLVSLVKKALETVKGDLTFPVSVYQTISDYMVTDISIEEFTYLASQAVSYRLGENLIRNISGEMDTTDIYAQFYPDEKALYELILEIFYEKVS